MSILRPYGCIDLVKVNYGSTALLALAAASFASGYFVDFGDVDLSSVGLGEVSAEQAVAGGLAVGGLVTRIFYWYWARRLAREGVCHRTPGIWRQTFGF